MAGPKEEWFEWDRRFQFGYSCLNQRLKAAEEATQQIAQLEEKTKLLTANSKHLEEANDGLRDRIQKLEKASDQIAQLNEQIQDLTASSRSLKEENNVMNDRILQLEQEGSHRDEENRLIQQQLKEKLNVLEENSRSVVVSISGMHEIATAERDQRGQEIQQLRSQVEALIATKHNSKGYARDGKLEECAIRRTVSNLWYSISISIKKTIFKQYSKRKVAYQSSLHTAAQRRLPGHPGPRRIDQSSRALDAL